MMSKRFLRHLVESELVDGWDDPRMPTLCGLRRRGYTAASILDFCDRIGVAKSNSTVELGLLEACIRDEMNRTAPRRIAVLDPIKLIVDNYPEDRMEYFELPNNPQDPEAGTRRVPFSRELYIDREDFALVPPPKFFRLKPEGEVRLMGAYIVRCGEVVQNANGSIKEIHVTADLATGCGMPADGRKIKGTIHWLSAAHAIDATVMLYDRLFTVPDPANLPEGQSSDDVINPDSCIAVPNAKLEPSLAEAKAGDHFQFVRTGYFVKDTKNENTFNRTVGLKDSFPKN